MFDRAIVRVPSANLAMGLTTVDLGKPDYARAIDQHDAYCAALRLCGLTLTTIEPDDRYPDSTFVEDTAVLTEHGAILTRPGAPSRAREVNQIANVLTEFYSELHSIRSPGTLDAGDVCEAGTHFFIGISQRTNEAGATQLAEILSGLGYTSSFIDIRGQGSILHLKSGIAYLGDNRLVTIDSLANLDAFREYDLIRVGADEEYAANCVRVNNRVLVARGYPGFEGRLRDLGYETIALDMSEFQKMDGGLSCLSLRF